MRSTWNQALALLLSVAMAVVIFSPSLRLTPKGVHCPTAATQTVAASSMLLTNDGGWFVQVSWRQPQEGDSEFLQCQCAEKKAVKKLGNAKSAEILATSLEWPQLEPLRANLGTKLPEFPSKFDLLVTKLRSIDYSPVPPPPQVI